MKFVYFGYDFMLESVQRLLSEGHEPIGVFSFECDNVFNFNVKTRELAERLDIPFSLKKPCLWIFEFIVSRARMCF